MVHQLCHANADPCPSLYEIAKAACRRLAEPPPEFRPTALIIKSAHHVRHTHQQMPDTQAALPSAPDVSAVRDGTP